MRRLLLLLVLIPGCVFQPPKEPNINLFNLEEEQTWTFDLPDFANGAAYHNNRIFATRQDGDRIHYIDTRNGDVGSMTHNGLTGFLPDTRSITAITGGFGVSCGDSVYKVSYGGQIKWATYVPGSQLMGTGSKNGDLMVHGDGGLLLTLEAETGAILILQTIPFPNFTDVAYQHGKHYLTSQLEGVARFLEPSWLYPEPGHTHAEFDPVYNMLWTIKATSFVLLYSATAESGGTINAFSKGGGRAVEYDIPYTPLAMTVDEDRVFVIGDDDKLHVYRFQPTQGMKK